MKITCSKNPIKTWRATPSKFLSFYPRGELAEIFLKILIGAVNKRVHRVQGNPRIGARHARPFSARFRGPKINLISLL